MTNPITLDAIRVAKTEAEAEIMDVLARLKERTGLCAVVCRLRTHGVLTLDDRQPRPVLASVTLELESI